MDILVAMKIIITFIFSIIFLNTTGQFIPRIEPVIYDKDNNIIASLDYVGADGSIEISFRDTVTNIRYKLDKSNRFITAINSKGDTLWNVDPYIIYRQEYTIEATPLEYENINKEQEINRDTAKRIFPNIDRPDHITKMKLEKRRDKASNLNETVLYIRADTRFYGFLNLKTGTFQITRIGW